MKIINSRTVLADEIASLDIDASIAMCFIHGGIDTRAIVSVRNAERICDHVVVVNLSASPLNDVQNNIISRAGGTYLYEGASAQNKCTLDAGVTGIDATFMLQAILTVMPLTVTVAENNTHIIKSLKNILSTFGKLFTLQIKATPIELLTTGHRQLRESLAPILLNIEAGESDAETLHALCSQSLVKSGFNLHSLTFVDADTLEEHVGTIAPTSLLLVEASLNGQKVKDILSLVE